MLPMEEQGKTPDGIKNNAMEKINECTCTPAMWCPDENQMEPPHQCEYCAQQERTDVDLVSFVTSLNRPNKASLDEDDDERDDSEDYDDLPF